MKILYYGETPAIETGAGQVAKHLIPMLASWGHTLEIVPINHTENTPYDRQKWPYVFHYASAGEMHNIETMQHHILHSDYDILFLTGDINVLDSLSETIIQAKEKKRFETVIYAAIDCDIIDPGFIRCLAIAEYPVVFSRYAYNIAVAIAPELRERLQVIYHGCEPGIFHPVSPEERAETRECAFQCTDDDFLIINVNRNQVRKDLGRTLFAFRQFYRKHPDSRLYLHARMQDSAGHLPTQAALLGLDIAADPPQVIFSPPEYSETVGLSREALNRIYNAADVVISTSTGEGWGLTTTEAMAAGVPFIGPRNTTFPEILGEYEERGYLVQSGGPDLWSIHYEHSEGPRELVSVTDMVRALEYVYAHREPAREKARAARKWTEEHTWDQILREWKNLLCSLHQPQLCISAGTIG